MLHRHVNAMEYIENNIAVLVTVYGINQERRHYCRFGPCYSKLSNNHNLLGVEIHKDRFSLDTTHSFIITPGKTRFYDLVSALFQVILYRY